MAGSAAAMEWSGVEWSGARNVLRLHVSRLAPRAALRGLRTLAIACSPVLSSGLLTHGVIFTNFVHYCSNIRSYTLIQYTRTVRVHPTIDQYDHVFTSDTATLDPYLKPSIGITCLR